MIKVITVALNDSKDPNEFDFLDVIIDTANKSFMVECGNGGYSLIQYADGTRYIQSPQGELTRMACWERRRPNDRSQIHWHV